MAVKVLDCTNSAPAYNYTPFGFACYWNRPLPQTIKADIGPVTIPGAPCVGCSCYGFPSVVTRISLSRVTACDWQGGTIVWSNNNYQTGLTLFVNTYEKIFQNNPNINPASNVWSFSGCPSPTGSCSFDFITGQTSGTLTGIAEFEPQGCACAQSCQLPFTVYFDPNV